MEVDIGSVDEIPEGGMAEYNVNGQCVLVCRAGDAVYAVSGICPHRGAQLGQGKLDGTSVACPWHEWEFDVETGRGVTNPVSTLASYPVSTENGKILITLPDN